MFYSCTKNTKNSGLTTVLSPFHKINLIDPFDIYLEEDSIYSINIYGDEKNITFVKVNIDSNTLNIENERKLTWTSPKRNKIILHIKAPYLSMVKASGGCDIKTSNPITSNEFGLVLMGKVNHANLELDCNSFYYWNNFPCGGNLTLYGKTNKLDIWNFAIMSVDAKNLSAYNANIENSSKGNCELSVVNRLEYSIKGRGNIHLYSEPNEIIENVISSSGKLIQHQ